VSLWYLYGGLIPGANGSTYAATQAGVYTVIPISASNCRGQASNAITLGLIVRPTADFSFDAYCAGFVTNFTNLQVGISYDVTVSDLTKGPKPARSMEMSLQWRIK